MKAGLAIPGLCQPQVEYFKYENREFGSGCEYAILYRCLSSRHQCYLDLSASIHSQ